MRGTDAIQESLFTVSKLDDFVPADHPLRAIRQLANEALVRLNGLFDAIYADSGRDSIAPEKLMRALLLQVFYSVRAACREADKTMMLPHLTEGQPVLSLSKGGDILIIWIPA